jgi:DNA-binding NarL/FixJ family response regulator
MTRVLVADDHGIVRSGIRMLVERRPGMRVVAEAEDGAEALERAIAERPDLAILDVSMPRLTGIQATRAIRAHVPEVAVLLLSMHDDERYLYEALKAGARGYVLKSQADEDLLDAIAAVERGEAFVSSASRRASVEEWVRTERDAPPEPLTPRELEVVKLIAEAHTNREIAGVLKLAEKTVESHRANVFAKLGMRDRVEIVRWAIRRGLVEP